MLAKGDFNSKEEMEPIWVTNYEEPAWSLRPTAKEPGWSESSSFQIVKKYIGNIFQVLRKGLLWYDLLQIHGMKRTKCCSKIKNQPWPLNFYHSEKNDQQVLNTTECKNRWLWVGTDWSPVYAGHWALCFRGAWKMMSEKAYVTFLMCLRPNRNGTVMLNKCYWEWY